MTASVIRYLPRLNQFGERVQHGQIEEEFVNFVGDGLRLHKAVARQWLDFGGTHLCAVPFFLLSETRSGC
jgi:hypothetical protein